MELLENEGLGKTLTASLAHIGLDTFDDYAKKWPRHPMAMGNVCCPIGAICSATATIMRANN
jgi:hypothetical protein